LFKNTRFIVLNLNWLSKKFVRQQSSRQATGRKQSEDFVFAGTKVGLLIGSGKPSFDGFHYGKGALNFNKILIFNYL